jgi:hypothetical protein
MTLDYLGHLERDAARFADVLADADRQASVPSCPDWTADDLLWHLGEVFLFWATIVGERLADPSAAEAAKSDRRSIAASSSLSSTVTASAAHSVHLTNAAWTSVTSRMERTLVGIRMPTSQPCWT